MASRPPKTPTQSQLDKSLARQRRLEKLLIGKVVKSVEFCTLEECSIHVEFTDGTCFDVAPSVPANKPFRFDAISASVGTEDGQCRAVASAGALN